MKKTILLLLLVLPIVLLMVIAFAGKILSFYQHIPVERIAFVDRLNNVYTDEHTFVVNQGSTKETAILIYPELASNKAVTYTSSDESICTVDENGVISGIHYGSATVIVKTDDGGKLAMLNVLVKADIPYSVELSRNDIIMTPGQVYQLEAAVDAPVAVNKNVTYESDNPEVAKIDPTGKITALSAGTATITVTTVSGSLKDTCTVTVQEGALQISFDFNNLDGVEYINGYYVFKTESVNLVECLCLAEEINAEDVIIKIHSGSSATLNNGILTFVKEKGIVTIRAYVGNESAPTALAEIKLIFKP